MAAQRLLLGKKPVLPEAWRPVRNRLEVESLAPVDFGYLAAVDAIQNKMPDWDAFGDSDSTRDNLNEYLIRSISTPKRQKEFVEAWLTGPAPRVLPSVAVPSVFELLYLIHSKLSVESAAKALVRLLVQAFVTSGYTPAHLLAFAALCETAPDVVRALDGRAELLDRETFNDDDSPRLALSQRLLWSSAGQIENRDAARCEARITGNGRFEASLECLTPITVHLLETLEKASLGGGHIKDGDKKKVPAAVKKGIVVMTVKFGRGVEASAHDEEEFGKRFDVAWHFATGRLALVKSKITTDYRLEFNHE